MLRMVSASFCFVALLTGITAGHAGDVSPNGGRWALPSPHGAFQVEDLCNGTATYIDVELYRGTLGVNEDYVKRLEPFTAQLQWVGDLASRYSGSGDSPGSAKLSGQRWCTATTIARDLVITAGHCISIDPPGWKTPRRAGVPEPPNTLAKLMVANFKYQVDGTDPQGLRIREPVVYRIAELVEHGFDLPAGLDYAILRLEPDVSGTSAGERFGVATLDITERTRPSLPQVAVIQHPDGLPKKIETGEVLSIDPLSILYRNLDTLAGASGAGVLSDDRKLVGVHTHGGCDSVAAANEGVPLSAISRGSAVLKGLVK